MQQLRNRLEKAANTEHIIFFPVEPSITNYKPSGINLLEEYNKRKNEVQNEINGTTLKKDDVIYILQLFWANTQQAEVINPEASCCICCLCFMCDYIQCTPFSTQIRDACCIGQTRYLCPDTFNEKLMTGLHCLFHACSSLACCHHTQACCDQTEANLFSPKVIPYYVLLYAVNLELWGRKEIDFFTKRFNFVFNLSHFRPMDIQLKTERSIISSNGGGLHTIEDFIRNPVREQFVAMMFLVHWGLKNNKCPDFFIQTLLSYLYDKNVIVAYASHEWKAMDKIMEQHNPAELYFGLRPSLL